MKFTRRGSRRSRGDRRGNGKRKQSAACASGSASWRGLFPRPLTATRGADLVQKRQVHDPYESTKTATLYWSGVRQSFVSINLKRLTQRGRQKGRSVKSQPLQRSERVYPLPHLKDLPRHPNHWIDCFSIRAAWHAIGLVIYLGFGCRRSMVLASLAVKPSSPYR